MAGFLNERASGKECIAERHPQGAVCVAFVTRKMKFFPEIRIFFLRVSNFQ